GFWILDFRLGGCAADDDIAGRAMASEQANPKSKIQNPKWTEVHVEVPAESAEAVTAALLEAGCHGVSERGGATRQLVGFLPVSPALEETIEALEDRLARLPEFGLSAPTEFAVQDVEEADWANEW